MKINLNSELPPMKLNDSNLYCCPQCNSIAGKIYKLYIDDDSYTLQCPTHREHCQRKTNIPAIIATDYKTIPVKRCSICDTVLAYIDNGLGYDLVCSNDISHQRPVKTTVYEIEKLGYIAALQ